MNRSAFGFSLPETLVAMLLLASSVMVLLQYQRVLTQSFVWQWQQRESWRYAAQRLLGREPPGFQTVLESHRQDECDDMQAKVTSPSGQTVVLHLLRCGDR